MSSSLGAFVSSFFASEPIYNEGPAPEPEKDQDAPADESEDKGSDDAPADAEEEEEEEDDPEDPAPALRDDCAATSACAPYKTHFDHCQEKVSEGKGFPHEDCVEELFQSVLFELTLNLLFLNTHRFFPSSAMFHVHSLMHCVDNCIAPRLFNKLV